MHLKSILNRVEPLKSFVYKEQRFVEGAVGQPFLEVDIEPRANGRPICSGCGKKRPGYDRLAARRFEFVPLWNMAVFFVYAMRRVDCPIKQPLFCKSRDEQAGHLAFMFR